MVYEEEELSREQIAVNALLKARQAFEDYIFDEAGEEPAYYRMTLECFIQDFEFRDSKRVAIEDIGCDNNG